MNPFVISVFLGSAQLFLIQPMLAKRVLPVLGGAPYVWSTCMLFYQVVLLLGYTYAHLVSTRWPLKRQLTVHMVVLVVPIVLLLTQAPITEAPSPTEAVKWLLCYLTVAAGLPFFVLSTNAPLVQKWFAITLGASNKNAYHLYAASNLGSMGALLSYPLLIEPTLKLSQQHFLFVGLYLCFAATMAVIISQLWKLPSTGSALPESTASTSPAPDQSNLTAEAEATQIFPKEATSAEEINCESSDSSEFDTAETNRETLRESPIPEEKADAATATLQLPPVASSAVSPLSRWKDRAYWIFLAAIPSSLLLSVTTYMTMNIAPSPLFWVIPLALYLLSFILVFSPVQILKHKWMLFAHAVLVVTLALVFSWDTIQYEYKFLFPLHLLTFFVIAMVCHGQLANSRPDVSRLTEFYLCLSIGGAIGGTFNALVAPQTFSWLAEYPAGLALSCLARPRAHRNIRLYWAYVVLVIVGLLLINITNNSWNLLYPERAEIYYRYRQIAVIAPAGLLCLGLTSEPVFMCILLSAVLFVGTHMWQRNLLFQSRNIFGTLRVEDREGYHVLTHGTIMHGAEQYNVARPHQPLSYYHRENPIGHLFQLYADRFRNANIAVIGLGAGTMAAYAEPGQYWTFYELNPMVYQVAHDTRLFTYLADCKATNCGIDLGDARMEIAKAPDKSYMLIASDAFSSDAIPVHLLTREAIKLFVDKLANGGILAFHVSTRGVDLKPTLREQAKDANLACVYGEGGLVNGGKTYENNAAWVFMARSPADLQPLLTDPYFHPMDPDPKATVWTDDFSNLVETLRLN